MNASNNNSAPVFFTVVRISNILLDNYNAARKDRDAAYQRWHSLPPSDERDRAGKDYNRGQRRVEDAAASLASAAADPHQVVTRE